MKKAHLLMITLIFTNITTYVCSEPVNTFDGKWIDLTHDFSETSIYWPTADKFKKTEVFEGTTKDGFYYSANNFSAAEHGGTHLDAPVHFAKNRHTVEQIPLEQLIGPGIVIRVINQSKENRNYQLSVQDILNWENKYGIIADNSIVLIDTGSSKLWPNLKQYMGTDERGSEAVSNLQFPGIHPDAAEFLATKRKIKALGLDTPSIDFGGSTLFEAHQVLFSKNIPGFENVAHLDKLPIKGFSVIALPMKIKSGSGAPLRIVAFIPTK